MTAPLPILPYLDANNLIPDKYLSVNFKKAGSSVNGANIINQNLNTAPSGSVGFVRYLNGAWPARPTNRADIFIFWLGPSSPPGALSTDQWIDTTQVVISAPVLSPPRNISSIAGDKTVTIVWNLPANMTSVTGFVLTRTGSASINLANTVTSYTFSGLTNGTTYTFSLHSVSSSSSSVDVVVTDTPVAAQPTNPTYDPLTFTYGSFGSYKPSTSTTGIPANSPALTVITGTNGIYSITTPNARFDLIDFQCEVQIKTTGVIISRSKFRGNTSRVTNGALLNIPVSAPYNSGPCVTVYDSEFAPTLPSVWWSGIYSHDYELYRCEVSGCVDPFGAFGNPNGTGGANVAIYGCYADNQAYFSPDTLNHASDTSAPLNLPVSRTHNDIIQWQGGANLTIVGNYFRGYLDPTIGEANYSASSPNPNGGGPLNSGGGTGWNTNYPKLQINSAGMQISGSTGGNCSGLNCRNNWWAGCNRVLTLSQTYPSVGVVRDNIVDHDQLSASCFNVATGSDTGTSPSLVLANNVYSNDGSPVVVLHV